MKIKKKCRALGKSRAREDQNHNFFFTSPNLYNDRPFSIAIAGVSHKSSKSDIGSWRPPIVEFNLFKGILDYDQVHTSKTCRSLLEVAKLM